ncbi:hypothetical protein AB0B25_05000 [Nocardia sp. NPDC049190]|uniref:hypothetical protein n=1 Tax=Nocardia sp. NPDC049190 TaxID=3155650 RepID=UPI0033C98224
MVVLQSDEHGVFRLSDQPWPTLHRTRGASPALLDYIRQAETVMRKAVDILGDPKMARPLPLLPPPPPVPPPTVYIDNFSGKMAGSYSLLRNGLGESSVAWQHGEAEVDRIVKETQTAAEEVLEILRKNHVDPLNAVLRAAEAETIKLAYYSPAQYAESKLSVYTEWKLAELLESKMFWVQDVISWFAWRAGMRAVEFPDPPQPSYPLVPPPDFYMNRDPNSVVET